jgi:hypothetical protein
MCQNCQMVFSLNRHIWTIGYQQWLKYSKILCFFFFYYTLWPVARFGYFLLWITTHVAMWIFRMAIIRLRNHLETHILVLSNLSIRLLGWQSRTRQLSQIWLKVRGGRRKFEDFQSNLGWNLFSKYGDCGDLGPFFCPQKTITLCGFSHLPCFARQVLAQKKALLWEPGKGSVPICANF